MRLTATPRALLTLALALITAAGATTATVASAGSGVHWASAGKATIRPGVAVRMAGVACVAGFLLTDGTDVYVALPASCSGVGDGDQVNGCREAEIPPGTAAHVQGARYKATYVWSSFTNMALRGTTNANACTNNSLSLVRLDRRDIRRANPSVLGVGGPTGVSATPPAQGERLTTYVNAPAQAVAMQNQDGGWGHLVLPATAVPRTAIGAPVLRPNGRAVGMVTFVPQSGSPVTVTNLAKELAFLHTFRHYRNVRLALGTTRFHAV